MAAVKAHGSLYMNDGTLCTSPCLSVQLGLRTRQRMRSASLPTPQVKLAVEALSQIAKGGCV